MNSKHKSQRGQVLIIFVFAAVALVAITGLAIDGANVFSDRRHAQNAADTASLAAALYKVQHEKLGDTGCADFNQTCGANVKIRALDLALKNGYPGSSVEVHIPPLTGPYAHDGYGWRATDYVEVVISSDVDTFFARVLGIGRLHNKVQAVAMAKYRPSHTLYGGNSLVSLAPTGSGCPGEFHIGGTTEVTLNGGSIFVNSDNSCAFNETNCVTLNMDVPVQIVGGHNVPSYCAPPSTIPDTTTTEQVQFPPDPIFSTPPECGLGPTHASWKDGGNVTHIYPGYYPDLPPGNGDYFLEPGVYCTDSVLKITNPHTSFIGNEIFIWYKPGGYFSLQGGTVQLSAPTTGKYAGWLMYVDSKFLTSPDVQCTINGGANDNYEGVIYAPNCDVQINGTSETTGFYAQIIGYTFKVNGTSGMIFNYDDGLPRTAPEVNSTGLFR